MIRIRRLTLQLTPLLDLLLIVMFSQHLENRHRARSLDQNVEDLRSELNDEYLQRVQTLDRDYQEQHRALSELRTSLEEKIQNISDQHQQIGSMLAETLNLPREAIAEVVKLRSDGRQDDAERLEAALSRLRDLMDARGDEVFRMLMKIDEMQKRVSIWEVHLQDNGQARISDGIRSFTVDFHSESEFVTRLFEASKSFPDPRTLTLVLLSWGDTQGGPRQRAAGAMPKLTEQLRRDSSGTRWYDFSVLGYRATGPVLSGDEQP